MEDEKKNYLNELLDLAFEKLDRSTDNEIEIRDEEWKISVRVAKAAPWANSVYPGVSCQEFRVPR